MVYMDNAATTFPKPECVYQAMDTFYRTHGVNAGRGQFKAAAIADNVIRDTRNQIKALLRCNENYETIFTSSATEAINVILQGLDYTKINNVYVTSFEHNAVYRTLYFLQNKIKFGIIELATKRYPLEYDLKKIEKQFSEAQPNLIVATHASNVCGLITPVMEIALLGKKYNSRVIVDMAQTAGLIDINVTAAGVDAAVFAGHKTLYGPFGASGFVINKHMPVAPLIYGGTGRDSIKVDMPDSLPDRFEAGSRNTQAIAGLHESLKWLENIGIKAIYDKERELKGILVDKLTAYKNVRIVGGNNGVGIVSCVFDGYSPDEIGHVLDRFDIAVRAGLHCAPGAHRRLGTLPAGTVRFSLGYFNCLDDINTLDEALQYIRDNG